ncbi:hypothetical protein RRG08_043788 [Elysia crispata]|uniref:Uncharacterized protein n=1 Tax=Elysia crispata TaxID=231223 RepID=A0AAE0Z4R9_9GAST|nr:hypothetical protein RRG08_043788 [Elysia crispata]
MIVSVISPARRSHRLWLLLSSAARGTGRFFHPELSQFSLPNEPESTFSSRTLLRQLSSHSKLKFPFLWGHKLPKIFFCFLFFVRRDAVSSTREPSGAITKSSRSFHRMMKKLNPASIVLLLFAGERRKAGISLGLFLSEAEEIKGRRRLDFQDNLTVYLTGEGWTFKINATAYLKGERRDLQDKCHTVSDRRRLDLQNKCHVVFNRRMTGPSR